MNRLLSLFSLLFVSLLPAAAQNSQSYLNDIGSTAYGINIPVENGFIDISNGNLHLEFPLAAHPQRGALSLNESLVYDSRIWMFSPFGTKGSYHWWPYNVPGSSTTSGGWRLVKGNELGSISYSNLTISQLNQCGVDGDGNALFYALYTYLVSWTDPGGTLHPFNASLSETEDSCTNGTITNQSITPGGAADGSGYAMTDDGTGNPLITDNTGTEVYPQVIDRYGNYFSSDANGNLVDDTGRIPVITTTSGNTTYYDVLSPNGGINNQGTRVRYTVTSASVNVSTNFGQQDTYEWTSPGLLTPVQSILLPDGSQYSFTYDSYGELNSITLPTGGVIQYGYSNFLDSSNTQNRWLTSRTVGSNAAMTFTPTVVTTCKNYSTGCVESVKLHKPSGDETVYQLTLNNGNWNTGTTIYSGTAATGTKLLQVTNANTYTNGCTSVTLCNGANYLSQAFTTTALFANSSSTQGKTVYSQSQVSFNSTVGKISDEKDWDYVTTSPSTTTAPTGRATREIQYTYSGVDPYQVTVLDSSGNQAGQTTYGYTTSATATSGVTGHGTQNAGGPYLKTVSHWLNTGGASTTTYKLDDTGMVVSVVDPNSNPASSITYQCSNSLPYQSTNPLAQTTQYSYDCASGAIEGVEDPNDLANKRTGTTYAYEATAGRLYTQTRPDGGVTTYSYPSATEVDTAITATPDPTISSSTIVDAFGRPSESITAGTEVDTSYDTNGRANCTSNPYTQGGTTAGSTCISSFDGLDRPLKQTQADGSSTLQWSYSANTSSATNEASQTWTRTLDSFGRLTSVVEPGALTTNYTYDGLGNTSSISQLGSATNGDTSRVRSFLYDSMSHLLRSSDPESGIVCYGQWTSPPKLVACISGYDANGNLLVKTDARGLVTSYAYDALNRLTSRSLGGAAVDQYLYDGSVGQYASTQLLSASPNALGRLSFTRSFNPSVVSGCNVTTLQCDDQYFSYDAMGHVNQVVLAPPSEWGKTAHTILETYDLAGNMSTMTYPDGRQISQSFDSAGRLQSVVDGDGSTYVKSIVYNPDGSPGVTSFGNGVQQSITENTRLQVSQISVANVALNTTFLNHTYCYSSSNCSSSATANNGNIWQISDQLNSSRTQGFGYDALNRITSFTLGGTLQQQYGYDSFGNLAPTAGVVFAPKFNASNQVSGYTALQPTNNPAPPVPTYDASGNEIGDTDANGAPRSVVFDAAGRVSQLGPAGQAASTLYTYEANGARIRKDNLGPGTFTEYANVNGTPIAEKDQTGVWTDFIYANGTQIARVEPYDVRAHLSGSRVDGTQTGVWGVYILPLLNQNVTIQTGDLLSFRMYQRNAYGGISLGFTDGSNSDWYCGADQHGQCLHSEPTSNSWVNRTSNIGAFANGKTISTIFLEDTQGAPQGTFDVMIADMSIVRANGTIIPLLGRSGFQSVNGGSTCGQVNAPPSWPTTCAIEKVTASNDFAGPPDTTIFQLSDHLGTAQLEVTSGGWPVWQGQFAPFGGEMDANATTNSFRFTGLERDAESGLDHAEFRQYASTYGRWASPDPYLGSIDASNPQTFNRYAYVGNMPLSFTDPSGLDGNPIGGVIGAGDGCIGAVLDGGSNPFADIACAWSLGSAIASEFRHPKFTASHTPRPNAHIWDEHGSYRATPNGGIGDLLGISGAGCEFGACGAGPSSFGPGSWSSGAYPNGNDPNDLNLFGGFWDALKETIFGKKPSAVCIEEAKTFQAKFVKAAPYSRTVGLFGGIATSGALNSVPGGAYLGYQFAQSQIDAAYTSALRSCMAAGR